MSIYLVFIILYLGGLIAVGAYKARSIQTHSDFALAGRKMSVFVLTGTLVATWIGTGSIFGAAEEAYNVGFAAWIIPFAVGLGIVLLSLIAGKIRSHESFTIQDILEKSFGPASRVIGAITLTLTYVIIVSYQYRAGAAVIERVIPDISTFSAILFVAVFVILYTVLAGMYSVAYTDVINGILMLIGFITIVPILYIKVGGMAGIANVLPEAKQQFMGHYSLGKLISILLPAFLLILGDANSYERFFSAKSVRAATLSARWMFIVSIFLEWIIIFTAILGLALVSQGIISTPTNAGHIIISIAFEALPPIIGALLMATIVAVVVSTADSCLLVPSTSFVRDIYQRFFKKDASEKHLVAMSRLAVVGFGLIALIMAFMSKKFFSVALFAYTLYGASITPALLAALIWKKVHYKAGTASMVVGLVTALLWKLLQTNDHLPSAIVEMGIDAVIPAALFSTITLIAITLIKNQPSPETV